MDLQYELVPDDYAAWARYISGPQGRVRLPWRTRLTVPAIAAVPALLSLSTGHTVTAVDLCLLAAGIAWVALIPWWFSYRLAGRLRVLAQVGSAAGTVGYHELVVDDTGVTQRNAFGVVQRFWPGLQRVEETATHLFIFFGRQSAFIVPKSWVGDASSALREAVEEGIRRATPA